MFDTVNRNPNSREIRKFALTMLLGMPVAGALWTGLVWLAQEVWHVWIFASLGLAGLVIFGLSLISAKAGRLIYVVWHMLGAVFEQVISFISTLIMYYLTIVPIGLIMRLMGRKPLPLQFDRKRNTYWKDCKEENDLKRYFRQY